MYNTLLLTPLFEPIKENLLALINTQGLGFWYLAYFQPYDKKFRNIYATTSYPYKIKCTISQLILKGSWMIE